MLVPPSSYELVLIPRIWISYEALVPSVQELTSYRALVLFNAVNAALAVANANAHPMLIIGGQQLGPLCHNALQQTVLAMPGRDVAFVQGRITPQQLMTHRPSYVNALLIQSRGVVRAVPCAECSRRGLTPFPDCASVQGHFGGSCGNCKWRDHAARCNPPPEDLSSEDGGSGNESDEVQVVAVRRAPQGLIAGPVRRGLIEDGSRDAPIVL
jgi:hypothetical protein